jgi:hypothetical protein
MPKFVAICEIASYMSGGEKEVFRFNAKNYEEVLRKLFKKRHGTNPIKRSDYDDVEEYREDLEDFEDQLEQWIDGCDRIFPGVWEMVYDDTAITIVKVAT